MCVDPLSIFRGIFYKKINIAEHTDFNLRCYYTEIEKMCTYNFLFLWININIKSIKTHDYYYESQKPIKPPK